MPLKFIAIYFLSKESCPASDAFSLCRARSCVIVVYLYGTSFRCHVAGSSRDIPQTISYVWGGGVCIHMETTNSKSFTRLYLLLLFFISLRLFFYRLDGINLSSGSIRVNGRAFSRRIGAQ